MTDSGVRQLKAIMFTDIKGFSAMMGADEERTMRLVREHREIVRGILPRHNGHEHETIGDAFVVLFDSAVQAVQCAQEIQARFRERNADEPEEEQVWIRIGIHLGDIIVHEGDIYGDGVNIAARVEPLAEPGGICITQDVYLQVQKKVGLRAVSIGVKELKNITEAPEIYRLLLEGDAVPDGEALAGADGRTEWPEPPLWKTVLWWAVTLPMALFWALMTVFTPDVGSALAGAFGLPESLPFAVSLVLAALISAGLVWAILVAGRYWRRGVASVWLHGARFLVFPALGLLLVAYHYLTMNAQLGSYLVTARSYAQIGEAQADNMTALFAGSIASYLNSASLDQLLVGVLSLIVLLSVLFTPRQGARTPGAWKRWLIVPVSVVFFCAMFAAVEHLQNFGPFGGIIFVTWLLTAIAVIRMRRSQSGELWPGWQAVRAGLITCLALSGAAAALGFIMAFSALDHVAPEDRASLLRKSSPIVYNGKAVLWLILAAFFAATLVVNRRTVPVGARLAGKWRNLIWSAVICVVTAIPIFAGMGFMRAAELFAIPSRLPAMSPITSDDASAYVHKRPQPLVEARKDFFAVLTERDRDEFTVDGLVDALAAKDTCTLRLTSSISQTEEPVSARCVTAIEARLYCEAIGLRLPTPEEWEAALGEVPVETPEGWEKPFSRGPFAEWTMRLVHGNPEFEIEGAAEVEGAPTDLKPSAFSDEVGFRCAFSFEEER